MYILDKKTWVTDEEEEENSDKTAVSTVYENINGTEELPVGKISGQKKQTRGKSAVKAYFEKEGLQVVDLRSKGGMLWVVGEEEKLKPYVDYAIKECKINGMYTTSKMIGFISGWCTKTKK